MNILKSIFQNVYLICRIYIHTTRKNVSSFGRLFDLFFVKMVPDFNTFTQFSIDFYVSARKLVRRFFQNLSLKLVFFFYFPIKLSFEI